jgi:hypothetical protein
VWDTLYGGPHELLGNRIVPVVFCKRLELVFEILNGLACEPGSDIISSKALRLIAVAVLAIL